jgi:hypothetical protein
MDQSVIAAGSIYYRSTDGPLDNFYERDAYPQ